MANQNDQYLYAFKVYWFKVYWLKYSFKVLVILVFKKASGASNQGQDTVKEEEGTGGITLVL